MEMAIAFLGLLIVLGIIAIKMTNPELQYHFSQKDQLFTPVERSFLTLIEDAIGSEYRILCRVRLADLLSAKQHNAQTKAALKTAKSKELNFVLCRKSDMRPIAAIDLVNPNEQYKQQKDWFVTGALDSARIAHVRIKVKSGYKASDIRTCIVNKIISYGQTLDSKPMLESNKRLTRPLRSNKKVNPQAA
jgi:hypothetical protein